MQTGCTGPRIICPSSPVVVTVVGSPMGSSPAGGASLLQAASSSNAAATGNLGDFNRSVLLLKAAVRTALGVLTDQDANRKALSTPATEQKAEAGGLRWKYGGRR